MLLAVFITIVIILNQMDFSLSKMITVVWDSQYSKIIETDVNSSRNFFKMFISGMFITIVMTGLDQDMMQKNLSCKNLKDAQKNMTTLSLVLVPVNLVFLFLGAVLYVYAAKFNIALPDSSDHVFPAIAFGELGIVAGIVFIIGLISAAYSSADSALTSLTTSFSIDILELDKKYSDNDNLLKKSRQRVHIAMALIIIFVIISFDLINNQAIIHQLFTFAGYTYGPLLGLFSFGLFTKYQVNDKWVPLVAIVAPILSYLISHFSESIFNGYEIGFELLIINGILTVIGLYLIRKPQLITNN